MTYKVEQFVAKIESPVVAKIGDHSIIFQNREAFANASFCEPVVIDLIYAEDMVIIWCFRKKVNEWIITEFELIKYDLGRIR